jgi:hypothetical protein
MSPSPAAAVCVYPPNSVCVTVRNPDGLVILGKNIKIPRIIDNN